MQVTRLFTILLMSFLFSAITDSLAAQTITHVPLYTFYGDNFLDEFGRSVSGAGDVNGDGFADLIVGAAFDDNNGFTSGSARVLSGFDGSVLYTFNGDNAGDLFGRSVSGAGDVNGDGFADLIVGSSGIAHVLSGSDGSVLYNFSGDSGLFGDSVSGAGDVNGDGTPDLIVGAPFDNNSGSARVLSGSDGSVLHNFYGDSAGDEFGRSVSGAGDVNGDGFADLIVGAPRDDNNGNTSGSARVLSGSDGGVLYSFDGDNAFDFFGWSVSGAGDVNGDGFADLIVGAFGDDNNGTGSGNARVLSGSDGSVLHSFDGDSGQLGHSVSCAGDVNGDGKADLIVGSPNASNNARNSGSARVLSGSDGSVLYNFSGGLRSKFGTSVGGAGDVNGDGLDDFIVGADEGGANGGGYAQVFVSQILGDCNQDGSVNFLDISPFIAILTAGDFLGQADTNEDGAVNFLDIARFIALLTS